MYTYFFEHLVTSKIKYSEKKSKIELHGRFCSVDIVRIKMKTEQIEEGIKEHRRIYERRGCREDVERVTKYLVDPPNNHIHEPFRTLDCTKCSLSCTRIFYRINYSR